MSIRTRLADLRKDLLSPMGPAISTNRNYPFAIFHYSPSEEFEARSQVGELARELQGKGWKVRTVDLFAVLIDYLNGQEGGELLPSWIEEEKLLYKTFKGDYTKLIDSLKNHLGPVFDSMDAYPSKVLEQIKEASRDSDPDRTAVFLSRIGALYPFYRTSSLLRFIDEGVRVPVIVLYPGTRVERNFLSFMGRMDADRDYRPRIY